MITDLQIQLATSLHARAIAALSRTEIEHGLPWRWTPARVRRAIAHPATNVAVALDNGVVVAFGIMSYDDEIAHLQLLAVDATTRQRGIGSALLLWLEAVARVAGITRLRVEAREDNVPALIFYRKHGYHRRKSVAGMYEGVEDGVLLEKVVGGHPEPGGEVSPR